MYFMMIFFFFLHIRVHETGLFVREMPMNLVWALVVLVVNFSGCFTEGMNNTSVSTRPDVVNVASILTFDSIIGKVAKIALQAAIEDVNSDPTILKGTKLKITFHDSNYSGFLSMMAALQVMETEAVALIGPQSSVLAHVISHVANELQVPLLSFTATDPTLSSLQYPFFVRTTHSDLYQMAAIADIVEYYEWRHVIAIYIDDDHGRNGIISLGDRLAARGCKISHKAPISPQATKTDISDVLVQVALMESRVLVVHTYANSGLDILEVAKSLQMLDNGYVWIATNWLSTNIDISSPLPLNTIDVMQGFITLRSYTKESNLTRKFASEWRNLTTFGLSTYCLYAYDTVWLLARALDAYFDHGGNMSFSKDIRLNVLKGEILKLNSLSIFNGGNLLLQDILKVKMKGLTGVVEYTSDKDLVFPAYEVLNVIGTGVRKIGYWSNSSGLSSIPPETVNMDPLHQSSSSEALHDVIWPGPTMKKPRGWVFPENGRQMVIGVPHRVSYTEFVGQSEDTNAFKGYCIDVFTSAVNLLPYAVPYKFQSYGDGVKNPSNTKLVSSIDAGVFDAAVGDIAITTNRTQLADFSQPFIESGLVVVAPVTRSKSSTWAFLRPFSPLMWCVSGIFFIVVGVVVWTLEHRINDEFRGPPKKQIVTVLWFSFSTMFSSHRENTLSALGRMVLILWLFVVLIINSSYTANLTSILTVQKLYSPIKGIDSLMASKDPIGYPENSFVRNYLIAEYGIHEDRLIPLSLPEDFEKALKAGPNHGGVAAVVDERAYLELFLSTRCDFSIVGQEFTKNGWGFAFPRDSPLAADLSTAILKLSENGELQRIHDKWLLRSACSSQGTKFEVDQLEFASFQGLFFIFGMACFLVLIIYIALTIRQFYKHYPDLSETTGRSIQSGPIKTFISFVDEKEETTKARSKRKFSEGSSSTTYANNAAMQNYNSNRTYASNASLQNYNGSRIDMSVDTLK
ncbi:putative periplasmic binding protein-like I [Helianthus annuus]|nr:putative periplasmic binding protein-like I [Helianthus annuus]KAJ0563042.1 putative periplasmic binding protein-like I [Helianthus annuus]KAJ0728412.1 putative periplasmic binding protein-like I [Helianthus annuus]KAJ0731170.1 putative periplasmic binding protein-like I [Helianthus annuus]